MTALQTAGGESHTSPEAPGAAERVYFPELDGLRFVAFVMVYLFHGGVPTHLLARLIGKTASRAFMYNGGYGVQLFFILSGYLITALLLREEARYGRISLRAFWARRVLRIWPLYYLIIAIGFGLLPALMGDTATSGYRQLLRVHLIPFLAFLGNWSMALVIPVPYEWISVLWSVCIEEQFYLIAPLLFACVVLRYRILLVGLTMVMAITARWMLALDPPGEHTIVFNTMAQLDTLGCGVLLALVVGVDREHAALTRWARWLQWPLYAVIAWGLCQPELGRGTQWHRTWDNVWVWLAGAGIVLVAVWGRGWLKAALSYGPLVWLGKISYGLYMYHEIAIWARDAFMKMFDWFPNRDELVAIGTLALTIALAAVSYYAYERRFLVLKRRWTRVPSRPE
jgi:peptidoglycan/LPS O-acetylase OafA/YrhL